MEGTLSYKTQLIGFLALGIGIVGLLVWGTWTMLVTIGREIDGVCYTASPQAYEEMHCAETGIPMRGQQ